MYEARIMKGKALKSPWQLIKSIETLATELTLTSGAAAIWCLQEKTLEVKAGTMSRGLYNFLLVLIAAHVAVSNPKMDFV
ncbi:hypothetical protein PoB_005644900 [Plakobranchus ocellatus]|uniref:Uncharacterized protein n=1 Tax=Plakobranchus ocellatus TaxID=259542 RepID=A0AAV4CBJ0_9GAST|nr:hypothetical protein PoB_005644900 [Plakobranchus ocellatus]